MTSLAESVRSLTVPIGDLGGRWMLHPETIGRCREWGYANGYAYYVAGRGGVLGDVDADVVTAAFAFFAPSLVRTMWERGVVVEGAQACAQRYAQGCAEFGRRRLVGFEGVDQLADLAARVVDGIDVTGLSLFAGWRAIERPVDSVGRASLLLHALRELRGSVHIVACVAAGLEPHAAVTHSGGVEQAEKFGWSTPHPTPAHVADRAAAAEALTDELLIAAYGRVIEEPAAAELARLVDEVYRHVGPRSPS
jgi:hypothetical protein